MTQAAILAASGSPGTTTGFKNRIINGAMMINQRGFSGTPASGDYTLDRWFVAASQASKFTVSQNAGSVTTPAGFINYLGVTSSSAYTVGASELFNIAQVIEGLNIADLGWGTASAKTVTLSFQVYSSLTGTFGGSLSNGAFNYSYPFSYSIPAANTWTTISVTIVGPTSGTWLTTNGLGIRVYFGLGVGSTYSGTAGSWSANGYTSATGATSVVGTNGATFYITGVQLEVGTTATNFDFRSYGTELQLCQRYYEISNQTWIWSGYVVASSGMFVSFPYKVTKRTAATPTVNFSAGTNLTLPLYVNNSGTDGATVYMVGASNGFGYYQYTWGVSAEL